MPVLMSKQDEEDSEDVQLNGHNGDPEEPSDPSPLSTPLKSNEMEIVERSQSQRAIQNLLRVYYEPLELWFLRTSIEKVITGPVLISTCLEIELNSFRSGSSVGQPRDIVKTPPVCHSG